MIKFWVEDLHGKKVAVEAQPRDTVMSAVTRVGVGGVESACGGVCSCAGCHLQVEGRWLDVVGPAEGQEAELLMFTNGADGRSRLSCQIPVTEQLQGALFRVPKAGKS